MKQRLFLIALMLISFQQNYACICRGGKLPFRSTAQYAEFVALIKVLSYDYVEKSTSDNKDQKPSAINVEIIKKYKGKESRKRLKVWGNIGSSCWVNINSFKIGHYYLVAPYNLGTQATKVQQSQDYAFSFCNVNALSVKYDTQKAFGKYSKTKQVISLEAFEKDLIYLKLKSVNAQTSIKKRLKSFLNGATSRKIEESSISQQIGLLTLLLAGCIVVMVIFSRLQR